MSGCSHLAQLHLVVYILPTYTVILLSVALPLGTVTSGAASRIGSRATRLRWLEKAALTMASNGQHIQVRPSKLRKFSCERGTTDAEEFLQEAKLLLALQPLQDVVAATWIISAQESHARQEIIRLPVEEINTPNKIYKIIEQTWGEQRDSNTLTSAFYRCQQRLRETVTEYANSLQSLWAKANATQEGFLDARSLLNQYASSLHSPALRKDIPRLIREKSTSTFEEVKTEAQRWMHEDSLDAAATDQLLTTPNNEAITGQEGQIASLTAETASLRQTLHQQYDRPRQPFQQHPKQHQRSGSNHNLGVRASHPAPQKRVPLVCTTGARRG